MFKIRNYTNLFSFVRIRFFLFLSCVLPIIFFTCSAQGEVEIRDIITSQVLPLLESKKFEEAENLINHKIHNTPKHEYIRRAKLTGVLSFIQHRRGDYTSSSNTYKEALSIYRKKNSDDTSFVAEVYCGIAANYFREGDLDNFKL